MRCRMCNEELINGAKFCYRCGTKVGLFCSKCGTELPDNAAFCFNCGTKVGQLAQQPSVQTSNLFDELEMEKLSAIKEQAAQTPIKGAPVWDETPSGACDCAVGECDCDGSIWR